MRSLVAVTAVLLAGCPRPAKPTTPTQPAAPLGGELPNPVDATSQIPAPVAPPKISIAPLGERDTVQVGQPPAGTYRIHMIDVGTGLAILVQGADFNMLYDGGTNDAGEKPFRVVQYLHAVMGESGDATCVPKGAAAPTKRIKLDHVVLSHPHADHGSALDLVVHCFDVQHVWDSGRVNDAVFYRDFITAVGASAASYHTAADVPADHLMTVKGTAIKIAKWDRFSEGDVVKLGAGAQFTILHAEGKKLADPNMNSVVVALEAGGARVLLVGDAESGERKDPSEPVGDIEKFLVEQHAAAIKADILQVGHHGSKTSSRMGFLEVVKPKYALVSTGPKLYGKVKLPDTEVLEALAKIGAEVLRTDLHDAGECPLKTRIGGDTGPGGCDGFVITIEPGVADTR